MCAPDDGRRNRLIHVEHFTEINKLCNVASCWLYLEIKKKINPPLVRDQSQINPLHSPIPYSFKTHFGLRTILKALQVTYFLKDFRPKTYTRLCCLSCMLHAHTSPRPWCHHNSKTWQTAKSWSSSLYRLLHSLVTPSLSASNILLITLRNTMFVSEVTTVLRLTVT